MTQPRHPKVLMLSYPYPPAVSAGVQRTMRYIKYLPKFKWQPIVLTVQPHIEKILTDSSLDSTLIQSTDVVRVKHFELFGFFRKWRYKVRRRDEKKSRNPSAPGPDSIENGPRLRSRVSGSTRGFFLQTIRSFLNVPDAKVWWAIPSFPVGIAMIWRHRPKVIYSTAPPHSSHLLAIGLGIMTWRHVVLDFRDPWARSPWQTGNNSRIFRLVDSFLESLCIRFASAVVLNTNRVCKEFAEHYGKRIARKFFVVPNGYDPERLLLISNSGLSEKSSSKLLRILHPGTLYGKRSILTLARAILQLKSEGIMISFSQIGITKLDPDTERALQELGIADQLDIVAPLPHHALLQEMNRFDAFVVVQPDTPLQVPSKLYEMMMFSKPIIAITGDGETADLVREYRLGVVADPNDVNAIANGLRHLATNANTFCDTYRKHALRDFDGEILTGKLAEVFSSLD